MKRLIFGATGSIGRHLVNQATEHGHAVTALTRDPSRAASKHANLKVIKGGAMDFASVNSAVVGQDAVLCVLGAGEKGAIRSAGTRNIVRAMEKAAVRRLVCQSTLGVGDGRANLNFF